jgi:hypothetical protein
VTEAPTLRRLHRPGSTAATACVIACVIAAVGCRADGENVPKRERVLALAAMARLVPLVPEPQVWTVVGVERPSTALELPYRGRAALAGSWVRRDRLWTDASFVYASNRQLRVLNGGTAGARTIWRGAERETSIAYPAWSPDGSTLYTWLSHDEPLCAIDARTGDVRVIAELDTHVFGWNPWHFLRHFDPKPAPRPGGIVVDGQRLLVLLDEEWNHELPRWQYGWDRGGAWLAEVNVGGGSLAPLFDKQCMTDARSWDLSLARGLLYASSVAPSLGPQGVSRRWIEERRLDGELLKIYSETEGEVTTVELSPDGRLLLVGREYQPDVQRPVGKLKELDPGELDALVAAADGGFLVIDLETDAITDGPRRGSEARWAPDGNRVALVDGWAVNLCSLRERTVTPLIEGGPEEEDWYWGTWIDPVWSPDGNRLAITGRVLDLTLLLDLARREYFVLEEPASAKIWGLAPHLFGDAVGPGGMRLEPWHQQSGVGAPVPDAQAPSARGAAIRTTRSCSRGRSRLRARPCSKP